MIRPSGFGLMDPPHDYHCKVKLNHGFFGLVQKGSNWTVRPNPAGRIIRKPEGQIFNHKAEMTKNGKAKFDRKAE